MTHAMKSFAELKPPQPNNIGTRLSIDLGDYGWGIATDVGKFLGVSANAVSHWMHNHNGVNYTLVQKLGFLLGVSIDDLSDVGKFPVPLSSVKPFDATEFAREILEIAPQIKCKEFMVDAVKRAKIHLINVGGDPTLPPPVVRQPQPVAKGGFRDTVQGILSTAEKFRAANDIEWFIKDDGSLGAKRTVVEEF